MGLETPADDESARLSEIRSLDLAALRPKIDRLTRLADAPTAYVILVEGDRVWASGCPGHPEGFIDRELSNGARTLSDGKTLWVEDAAVTTPDHPWVTSPPYVRFYCAAPIRLASGVIIGAFCITAPEPRAEDPAAIARVEDLADLLADEIERMRTERSLAEAASEAIAARGLLAAFVQSAPVALAMTDRDLRFVQISPRWCEEHRVEGQALIGRSMRELFPLAYDMWGETWEGVLANGERISRSRVKVPLADGSVRWVRAEVSPWRNAAGEIGGILLMTTEIGDVVHALETAEHSEQRLRLALEIADLMVYDIDFRSQTLKVEGTSDTFFEKPMTYADVSDVWQMVHPDDRPACIALWKRHIKEGVPFRTEHRLSRADGREVWAFAATEMIHGEDGQPERLVGVLKNITERRQAEAAIVAARDAAENANRAKSEFLANMSHEIRTPLNGVIGVTAALSRTPLTAAQEEMIDLIQTSGRTLETILSDVLDLSRIESGRMELKPEGFDLESCLRSAAALFEPGAKAKGLAFGLDIAPEARGGFEGDAIRIRQIVSNLLSNAVKFTEDGGVVMTARAQDEGGATRIAISIADTGIGFSPQFHARLFERFEQADGSITRRFGGSGLGLAISQALAQAMGGSLEATSIPGRGATFTLNLRLARAEAPKPALEAVAASLEGLDRAPRVLLAEDHAVNRRVVELILDSAGVELTCVENGAQAVTAAARGGFDVVLMDMQMPVMDGLSAIRAIRAQEKAGGLPRTPIWGLSANALPEHVTASLQAGADGHLTKPVSAEALFGVIAQACAGEPDSEALSA